MATTVPFNRRGEYYGVDYCLRSNPNLAMALNLTSPDDGIKCDPVNESAKGQSLFFGR